MWKGTKLVSCASLVLLALLGRRRPRSLRLRAKRGGPMTARAARACGQTRKARTAAPRLQERRAQARHGRTHARGCSWRRPSPSGCSAGCSRHTRRRPAQPCPAALPNHTAEVAAHPSRGSKLCTACFRARRIHRGGSPWGRVGACAAPPRARRARAFALRGGARHARAARRRAPLRLLRGGATDHMRRHTRARHEAPRARAATRRAHLRMDRLAD
jgi:hypothetical protein